MAAGGMAEVYRALHVKLDKVVAIKFLDREHAKRPEVVKRFLREGRLASQVRHPNVVEVTDVDEHDGLPYLVMEFLEGTPLNEHIAAAAPLEPEAIARIMLPVCAAVAAAHRKGVIHRDLKPGNIFLTASRGEVEPKVLDFGISKSLGEDPDNALTTSASFLGTPIYLSPEQASGDEGTTWSDQYSLGVILYELATGERPYDKGQKFIRLLNTISLGDFKPPRSHLDALSDRLEAIIMRTMSLKPGDRYPKVIDLAMELLPVADARTRTVWEPRLATLRDGGSVSFAPVTQDREVSSGAITEYATATTVTKVTTRPPSAIMGSKGMRLVVGAVVIAAGALLWLMSGEETAAPPPPSASSAVASYSVVVKVEPSTAGIAVDGVRKGVGSLELELPLDGRVHHLEVTAEGFATQRFSFRDAPPPAEVTLEPIPGRAPAATSGSVSAKAAESSDAAGSATPPRAPVPKPRNTPPPSPTYSAHPDNIDPWKE